ncbi:MAG: hypothetical protein K5821_14420 [Nitrobacter sp.]|uniref:hypothetical protein n=1 Tax=Nitrobacter sp. TaxID=29420 RepID=UPI0026188190|nr:hypothetical protein [Nitrobacter sp.]MCV0387585.1 hypothetical protein [Nitrobacter sp.]
MFLLFYLLFRVQIRRMSIPADNYDSLTEIAEILALGLQRLLARQSSKLSAERGESSLHFPPDQSGAGSPIAIAETP